jgi:hypothetical protein
VVVRQNEFVIKIVLCSAASVPLFLFELDLIGELLEGKEGSVAGGQDDRQIAAEGSLNRLNVLGGSPSNR